MNKTRTLLFGSAVAAAMVVGGVVGAVGLAKSPLTSASAAAASPASTFHSNETSAHEKTETATREADENSGKAHLGPGGGPSNEASAHEAGESAAREAAELPGTKPTTTP
jgi:hypothetical protein